MDEKKCGDCGKELTIQEEIYYDIPSGSKKFRCQECNDKYMVSSAEGGQVNMSGLLAKKAGYQKDIEICYQEIERLQNSISGVDSSLSSLDAVVKSIVKPIVEPLM